AQRNIGRLARTDRLLSRGYCQRRTRIYCHIYCDRSTVTSTRRRGDRVAHYTSKVVCRQRLGNQGAAAIPMTIHHSRLYRTGPAEGGSRYTVGITDNNARRLSAADRL